MSAVILQFGRMAMCEACGKSFFDRYVDLPHCCPYCEAIADEAAVAAAESEARKQGFDSFDAWAAAGYPEKLNAAR